MFITDYRNRHPQKLIGVFIKNFPIKNVYYIFYRGHCGIIQEYEMIRDYPENGIIIEWTPPEYRYGYRENILVFQM